MCVQASGHCVVCVALVDLRCRTTVDDAGNAFDVWITTVRGSSLSFMLFTVGDRLLGSATTSRRFQ